MAQQKNVGDGRKISTALKVLALLQHRAPVALSSHGMGLQIQDSDKALSVVIKTLSRDGYIKPVGKKGLRTALWGLTEVGMQSLRRRADLAAQATQWLEQNPSYRDAEQPVLAVLSRKAWMTPAEIADETGLRIVSVRHAFKSLNERGLIEVDDERDAAHLNDNGQYEAMKIRKAMAQREHELA